MFHVQQRVQMDQVLLWNQRRARTRPSNACVRPIWSERRPWLVEPPRDCFLTTCSGIPSPSGARFARRCLPDDGVHTLEGHVGPPRLPTLDCASVIGVDRRSPPRRGERGRPCTRWPAASYSCAATVTGAAAGTQPLDCRHWLGHRVLGRDRAIPPNWSQRPTPFCPPPPVRVTTRRPATEGSGGVGATGGCGLRQCVNIVRRTASSTTTHTRIPDRCATAASRRLCCT